MNVSKEDEIIEKIKSRNWENRVQRPGFFQAKQIVCEALGQKTQLTKHIVISDKNSFWVNNSAIYDQDFTDNLNSKIFPEAFKEDPFWPIQQFENIEQSAKKKEEFVKTSNEVDWGKADKNVRIFWLNQYVEILLEIQKYYAFTVPLTNYCEKILKKLDQSFLEYATQYRPLDVDRMNESLFKIQKVKNDGGENFNVLLSEHLKKFEWIKSNYNIVDLYTREDVLSEIKSDIHLFQPKEVPESSYKHFVIGLQIGIYLRNRAKELAQQIWFAYEKLAKQLAADLSLSREDFLQLGYREVEASLREGMLTVSMKEIGQRRKGFILGVFEGKELLITGTAVDELFDFFNPRSFNEVQEISGTIACKGMVQGVVKVVMTMATISKLQEGDILVTSMTTPDFVVAMKKAGAIVTDEGGLSCHAAIVSRELRKPCIIGTRIAAKVLKDGDVVEVDADLGAVKILKKA